MGKHSEKTIKVYEKNMLGTETMSEISVVVCAKNAAATIDRCLRAISENQPLEIIMIIDVDSTDATLQISERYTDMIYSNEGKGLGYARQIGAEKARGDFVAYIDADTRLPDADALAIMLKELKGNGWVAIHAQLVDPTHNKAYWQEAEDFHFRNRFNKAGERRRIRTAVCLICRDIVLNYEFDPFFKRTGEDADFFYRVRKDGHRFGVSSVAAYHYHRSSFREFVRQRIWYGKAAARFIWKHKSIREIVFPTALIFFGILVCIKNRSIQMLPYYLTWGIFTEIGMLKEFLYLIMRVKA